VNASRTTIPSSDSTEALLADAFAQRQRGRIDRHDDLLQIPARADASELHRFAHGVRSHAAVFQKPKRTLA
jgi:hypothetical protein